MSIMNLHESLSFKFFIQRLFRLSVLNLYDFRATKRQILVSKGFIGVTSVTSIFIIACIFPGVKEAYTNNPIDQSSFSTTIGQTPLTIGLVISFVIWIHVNLKHEYGTKFYQKIRDIDNGLNTYMDLSEMYRKYRKASKVIIFPLPMYIMFAIFSAYSYAKDGLFIFAIAMVMTHFGTFFNCMYTNCFVLDVKLIRDRLKLLQKLCLVCDDVESYKCLTHIYKSLMELVSILRKMSNTLQGIIVINSFFSTICYIYMMIITCVLWNVQRSDTFFNILTILIPALIMLLQGFYSGEWLMNDVS